MNTLQSTRFFIFKKPALVVLCLIASVFLLKSISVLSRAHSHGQERKRINGKVVADKSSPAERLAFSENGPLGRWSGSIIPDLSRNSSNSPVVVIGTGALMGNKELRNLQLTHVTLKNHSTKTVLGTQLKWFVTTKTDRAKILPPPGYTGLFETYLKPGDTGRFESPLVMFSMAVKYLVSNGRLEGDFVVQVKVFQVEFEGGSTWNEDWGGPKPGEAGEPWHGPTKEHLLQNHSALVSPPDCPNSLCSYDNPDSSSFCDSDPIGGLRCSLGPPCSPDGVYCTCNSDPCSNPTPTPTPTPSPTPSPLPTPTPCPQGSFNPDSNGSCPPYAHKNSNNCCVCNQTNHTCPQGCSWIEHLCGCYNAFGPCGAPTPTPTPPPSQNCTTAGWNGDCPPGTQPDGFGWCCAEAGCGGFYATQAKSSGKDPTSNIINPGCCDDWQRLQCYQGGGEWYESQCACYSPVIIDVAGNGFNLTNAANGVMFDLPGAGVAEQLSWTSVNSDDAWLAMDRNGNGIIENGKELFGTFTAQPALAPGESKNGFRALAMFDAPAFGGNADGQIDTRDAIFSNLRLWQDRNHNGISEAGELQSLTALDIDVIELSYKESRRRDESGNWFRYRARVRDQLGFQRGRWAWDVFLQKP